METEKIDLESISQVFGHVLTLCEQIKKSRGDADQQQYEDLHYYLDVFSKILKIEKRENSKAIRKYKKEIELLENDTEDNNREIKLKELNSLLLQAYKYETLLDRAPSLAYYNAGKVFYYKDKDVAVYLLKKVNDNYEESYPAKLIINLSDKQLFNYCNEIGFYDEFLETLLNAFNHKLNAFKDFSLHKDLSRIRSKKKKVLIYLINLYVYKILDKLMVDFDEHERKVAHYTSLMGFDKLVAEGKPLRLNSADLMNDPSEGNLIFPYLGILNETDDNTFLSCFTFNHNSLNQFRLYGRTNNKEGTGISLVLNNTYFSNIADGFIFDKLLGTNNLIKDGDESLEINLPLFRCVYLDNKTGFIDVAKRSKTSFYQEYSGELSREKINLKWEEYEEMINDINQSITSDLDNIKRLINIFTENKLVDVVLEGFLQRSLRPLRFVFKHLAFQEEQECRIFYVTTLDDEKVHIPDNEQKVIFEYGKQLKNSLSNVYIGPALSEKFTYIRKVLIDTDVKIKVCDSPFFNQ
ncbi:DUF2971 domain-containing protein [Acinetobacter sp. YH12029]|uniref:DUF2971 domain-containing protein n=1 Tax=Acinetobacter sp. YH12029 TaxID=2601044 RepID=UPI0015D36166|nr:DUF2971 domain-containing protein [Acinetobacter sp. YH12029]